MTREDLLRAARLLRAPSPSVAEEYAAKRERLAEELNSVMASRPDVDLLVGGNLAMMADNHRNHARFFHSLFHAWDPEVLVDTVLWAYRAYRSHGFALTYWPAQLDTWVEVLKAELSAQALSEIYPVYHWMIVYQPAFVALSDASVQAGAQPAH